MILFILFSLLILASCGKDTPGYMDMRELIYGGEFSESDIPSYEGEIYTVLNGNEPHFTVKNLNYGEYEFYSPLDKLSRAGVCFAVIGEGSMPTEERESIGMIKPSGWHTVRYDDIIEGKYLYNRCHLIGYQLTGENANEKNLITGTRHFNVEGMLPFENKVASYIKKSGNHVFYRVTPIYKGKDLVACGVVIEAYSVEDNGEGIRFNVFVHNIQPGIEIDYSTGESKAVE